MNTRQNSLLHHLLDDSQDAVILFDAYGEIVATNRLAREFCTGDPSADFDSLDDDDVQLFDSHQDNPLEKKQYPHKKLLTHGTLNSTLLKIVRKSGKSRIVNVSGELIRDRKGASIGCLLRMRDLAVRKHRDESAVPTLNFQDDLQSPSPSDLELESFIYSVSHDLQAPLRHILGFSGLLNEEYSPALAEEGATYVSRIREACRKMQSQIFALLQLSRQTRGRMFWGSVNLSNIANAVVTDLRKLEPKRSVDVKVQDDLEVQGDQRLLIVFVEHLIGNAWKFTSTVENARIEFKSSEVQGGSRVFHISDNGVGFDVNRADKLFLPFRRFHGNQFEGSGIGLATALRVINRHNGKLWIDSKPGDGTTAHFTIG